MGQNRGKMESKWFKGSQTGSKVTKMGQNDLQNGSKWPTKGLFGCILAILRASWILLSIFWGPPLPTIVKKKLGQIRKFLKKI